MQRIILTVICDMATYFDIVRAIILDRGTKKSKIDRLQKECNCTAYEANTYYNSLMPELSLQRAANDLEGRIRFTIGVEIECFNIDKDRVVEAIERRGLKAYSSGYNHVDSKVSYKLGHDGSIHGNNPCEVVSPILKNLDSLETVCEVINEAGAQVNKSCGLHVHFGAKTFTAKQWQRIIVNYAAIEHVIDSFMPVSRRANNNRYCKSIAGEIEENVKSLVSGFSFRDIANGCYHSDRYYKLNVQSYLNHKTVEFRQHSGTTDFVKIKNWVDFLTAFLKWSLSHKEYMTANTIDELPFLTRKQKKYYKERKDALCV